MELRQNQYFIEVANLEHVTKAADQLHVAQSAVSRQLSNLEAELGVQLFVREGRNVRLTPVGKIFLEHVKVAVGELEKAKQEVNEYLNPETGSIKIGFPNSLASNTLPNVISAFRNEHPNINFQLKQGSANELTDLVVRGEISLAFTAPVPTNHKKVNSRIFFDEQLAVIVSKQHRYAENHNIQLRSLRNDPFVIYGEGFALRDLILKACNQVGFQPNVSFEGEDIDTIKGLVSAGLGVSILPEMSLSNNLPQNAKKLTLTEPNVIRTVGMIIPKHRELAPSEKIFFNFCKQFFDRLYSFGQ